MVYLRFRVVLLGALLGILLISQAFGATLTYDSLTGSTETIGTWGAQATEKYGQTTTVPVTHTLLTSFAFSMDFSGDSAANANLQVHVYNWNGSAPTGAAIWSSGVLNVSGAGFIDQSLNIGLNLVGGQNIVLYVEALSGDTAVFRRPGISQPLIGVDVFPGGFVFQNGIEPWVKDFMGTDTDLGVILTWDQTKGGGEVPEPSTVALVGAGVAVLLFHRRKR